MRFRIALWACAGALVVILWTFYISAASAIPLGIASTVLYLTCPIALARHYAMSLYFVLVVNAAVYALVGTVLEALWLHYRRSQAA